MDKALGDLVRIIQFTENVSVKIHGLFDEDEIYRTVRDEFVKSQRYSISILLLTDNRSKLRIAETSLPLEKLKVAEKRIGQKLKDYEINLNKSSVYNQVIREGKTLQVNISTTIEELFPEPILHVITKILGYENKLSILTPLSRHRKIIGAVGVSSTELAEYFIPSVKNLALHITNALEMSDKQTEQKRTEKALKEERNLLRTLIDNLPDLIYIKDTMSRFVTSNIAVARLMGVTTPDELVNKTDFDFYPHELANKYFSDEQEIIRTGKPIINQEEPNIDMAGKNRWLSTTKVPLRDVHGKIIGIVGIGRDITEHRKVEESLRESEEKFRNLAEHSPNMIFINKKGKIIYANKRCEEIMGYERVEFFNSNFDFLTLIAPESRNLIKESFTTHMKGEEVLPYEYKLINKKGKKIDAIITSKLIDYEGERVLLGIVTDITEFKKTEAQLQHTLQKLRKAMSGIIRVIAFTVETRDPYTAGHQRRATNLARAIADEMGLSKEQIDGIRVAGVIHDLGKISVPAEILSKPTSLSELEFNLIKTHPQVAYDILRTIEFSWPIAQIVYQHHERIDGSGYPLGLSSEEILIEAKILGVADVVEAMASHRPYRSALGIDEALDEISQNRGILYDPNVVNACLKLFTEKGFQFNKRYYR